jgi:hypothetical protein
MGGSDLRSKYGADYYSKMGKKGNHKKGAQTCKDRYGDAYHSVIGKKAVIAKAKKRKKGIEDLAQVECEEIW